MTDFWTSINYGLMIMALNFSSQNFISKCKDLKCEITSAARGFAQNSVGKGDQKT